MRRHPRPKGQRNTALPRGRLPAELNLHASSRQPSRQARCRRPRPLSMPTPAVVELPPDRWRAHCRRAVIAVETLLALAAEQASGDTHRHLRRRLVHRLVKILFEDAHHHGVRNVAAHEVEQFELHLSETPPPLSSADRLRAGLRFPPIRSAMPPAACAAGVIDNKAGRVGRDDRMFVEARPSTKPTSASIKAGWLRRPPITSTSRISGGGLKKCKPATRSGLAQPAAIFVTEREDVLVASTASGARRFSSARIVCARCQDLRQSLR